MISGALAVALTVWIATRLGWEISSLLIFIFGLVILINETMAP